MEKIQFKDLPNMTTPLSSANLNLMQDNMEDAIIPIKLISISATAPESATVGDMYYNTTDNKVYTATAENTWNSGETPRYDGFYINIETNLMYYYNGTSLIKSGGDIAPSVKNEETTSETDVYSCNYVNELPEIGIKLDNIERKTGRLILYNDNYYTEYVRKYNIDMVGSSNVNKAHELTDFLITKVEATQYNPISKTQFPLPVNRPNFPANAIGLFVNTEDIVLEIPDGAPDRTGQIAMVTLYYIKLNEFN